MKLSESEIKQIEEAWGDWERVHSLRDKYILGRLQELDPEFMESIEKEFSGATLWYA